MATNSMGSKLLSQEVTKTNRTTSATIRTEVALLSIMSSISTKIYTYTKELKKHGTYSGKKKKQTVEIVS